MSLGCRCCTLGGSLGDEDQLWPEPSTSAIVLHHPQARYFNV
jgi:5-methyltetrahydrofolate--homocysteine methyltransferase